jgi:predicted RNA-binding Zn-ribbon protein involved in translation (DUF1610 family)
LSVLGHRDDPRANTRTLRGGPNARRTRREGRRRRRRRRTTRDPEDQRPRGRAGSPVARPGAGAPAGRDPPGRRRRPGRPPGEGICTTREKKYAVRRRDRECPECGKAAILRSKHAEDDGDKGWFCWRRKGGCGANFRSDDKRIADQAEGEIENPDLPDTWNTIVKMAEKRARVDVVLAVTGASALFTQDVEDRAGPPVDDEVRSGKVPRWGVAVGAESMPRIAKALAYMLDVGDGPNEDAARQVMSTLDAKFGDAYDSLPAAAGHAIFETALLLSKIRTGPDQVPDEPTGDPAGEEKPADVDF